MRTLPQTAAYMWGGRCLKGPQRPDCAHPFSRSVRAAIWLPLRYAGRLRGRAWPIAIWAAGRSCRAGSTSSTLSLNWLLAAKLTTTTVNSPAASSPLATPRRSHQA